jgi:hypothetical protein
MNYDEITCIACGGTFSLTDFGKELYTENNISAPKQCLQCSIIKSINSGEKPKNMDSLIKTNSTFWTDERLNEYKLKSKETNSLYNDLGKGKSK